MDSLSQLSAPVLLSPLTGGQQEAVSDVEDSDCETEAASDHIEDLMEEKMMTLTERVKAALGDDFNARERFTCSIKMCQRVQTGGRAYDPYFYRVEDKKKENPISSYQGVIAILRAETSSALAPREHTSSTRAERFVKNALGLT